MNTYYWVNNKDVIFDVSSNWDTFALDNDGEESVKDCIVNTSVYDHIADDATKMWVESILNLARVLDKPIERHYRCDSDSIKRYMRLTVEGDHKQQLRLMHELIHSEVINPSRPFKTAKAWRVGDMVRCSICNKVRFEDKWIEIDEVKSYPEDHYSVAYTVCMMCKIKVSNHSMANSSL